MKESVIVQNLKCGGCATTITNKVSEIEGVSNVHVDVDTAALTFEINKEEDMKLVIDRLSEIGYPIEGDENSLMQKAKSFVSCAIGRMS